MGGAKNCPETPRQKMIGMMYLVLTAMLALNVSTNVLNAFGLVDKSLHVSLENAEEQNAVLYTRFEQMYHDTPDKFTQNNYNYWERIDSLRNASDSLFNYIENFKREVHRLVDGEDYPDSLLTREIIGMSDFDTPSRYAIDMLDPVTGNPNGVELRLRISKYRDDLIAIRRAEEWRPKRRPGQSEERFEHFKKVLADVRENVNVVFATDSAPDNSGQMLSWERVIFEGMPVGACMAILTKYQNDIRAYEGKTLTWFQTQLGSQDYKANYITAYVIPKSSYVLQGGQYEAQIILAAVDTLDKPQYFVDGVQLGEDGIYRAPATSVGVHPFSGIIRYRKGRRLTDVEFSSQFEVGQPSTTVMNLDLNVIYKGYDNRYLITCPGMTDSQLKVNVIGGTAKRSGKEWIVVPNDDAKEVKIVVNGEVNGATQKMGEQTFRVKKLPKADLYLVDNEQQLPTDKIIRKNLNANTTLEMGYGADGILNVPYEVVGFSTLIQGQVKKSKGNKFSPDQLKQIKTLKSKDAIIFMSVTYRIKGGDVQKYDGSYVAFLK